jgi:DNA-binding XRE family transcriptional regulator
MKFHVHLSTTACVRVCLGLTQQQLADSLGISRSALAMAETGRRPMPGLALPIIREMMAIAKKMPAEAISGPSRMGIGKIAAGFNSRVRQASRLARFCKKPFVTGQSSLADHWTKTALAKYTQPDTAQPTFSTHLLQSDADCQQLISRLSVKRSIMGCQLEYLQLEAVTAIKRGKAIACELALVNTLIQANLEIIAAFPLTSTKRKLEHRNAKLYCKKLQLEDRLENFDSLTMVLREHTINTMVKQLEILEKLIAATEKRRVGLETNQLPLNTKLHAVRISGETTAVDLQQRA